MTTVYVDIPWKRGSEGAQAALNRGISKDKYQKELSKWQQLLKVKQQLREEGTTEMGLLEDREAEDPVEAEHKRFGANRQAIKKCEETLASYVSMKDTRKGKGKKYAKVQETEHGTVPEVPLDSPEAKEALERLIERSIVEADNPSEVGSGWAPSSSSIEIYDQDMAVFLAAMTDRDDEIADIFHGAKKAGKVGVAVDVMDDVIKAVKRKADAFKVKWPESAKDVDGILDMYLPTMMARRTALLDSERHIPEDWEQMVGMDDASPIPQPNANERQLLLDGCKCDSPFLTNERPAYEQVASHPQLNTSRIVTSTALYIRSAKNAQADYDKNQNCKPVVVDVGAGSFGCERLNKLLNTGHYPNVYFHCMVPKRDAEDGNRHEALRASRSYSTYNFVPNTGRITRNRLNYCFHTASTCTCLALYSAERENPVAHPVCVHSSYYFEDADWLNLLKYSKAVRVAEHIPEVGTTLPKDSPEYEWRDGSTTGSYVQRLQSRFRKTFRGVGDVVLAPLRGGETTYRHADTSILRSRGGFHVTPWSQWANEATDGGLGTLKQVGKSALAGAIGSVAKSLLTVTMPTALGVCATAAACAATTMAGAYIEKLRTTGADPPWGATDTISYHNNSEYALKDTQEPIVTVFVVKRSAPRTLIPQCLKGEVVDKENVGRATAAMLMGKDNAKSRLQVAATLLRDRVPVWVTKSTVNHAERMAHFLGHRTAPCAPSQSPLPALLASICLPCALGVARQATSTLLAASEPLWSRSAVTASLLYWITRTLPPTLTFCFITLIYLVLRSLERAIWALVAPA